MQSIDGRSNDPLQIHRRTSSNKSNKESVNGFKMDPNISVFSESISNSNSLKRRIKRYSFDSSSLVIMIISFMCLTQLIE